MLHIELFHVRGNAMGVGRLGILMLHIELLHVRCAQIYSKPVATKSTPGRLGRKQVSIYCNESYSLCIAQRATPCLLCKELSPVCCCTESYFQEMNTLMTSICSSILTCARCSHMRLPHRKMQCISSLYNMRTHLCLFQQLLAHRVHVSRMQLLLSLLPEISDVLPSCITTASGRIILGETTSHQFSFDAMVCLAILSVDERCECCCISC